MTRFRQPPKYDIANSIEVWVNNRRLYAFIDSGLVVQQVSGKSGKTICRRVTSEQLEALALSRAALKVGASQIFSP